MRSATASRIPQDPSRPGVAAFQRRRGGQWDQCVYEGEPVLGSLMRMRLARAHPIASSAFPRRTASSARIQKPNDRNPGSPTLCSPTLEVQGRGCDIVDGFSLRNSALGSCTRHSITSMYARCPGALPSGASQVMIGASSASAKAMYMASYAVTFSRSFHARVRRSRWA